MTPPQKVKTFDLTEVSSMIDINLKTILSLDLKL